MQHMYRLHYDFIKQLYPGPTSTRLFKDTNSLCYQMTSNNIYADFQKHSNKYFDFSNFPSSHPNYSITNKKKIGMMKDENAGRIMLEFVGLRAKCYSFTTEHDIEIKKN